MQNVEREQVRKRYFVCADNCLHAWFHRALLFVLCVYFPSLSADINTSGKNGVPTVELIQELESDNVDWTAAQLETMSTETFRASVDILGPIAGYNADQLAVLSKKATEVQGD